ncbi:hypothetical protein K2X30_04355 [bacterium]|nr:hypothetical protein [bacterium]
MFKSTRAGILLLVLAGSGILTSCVSARMSDSVTDGLFRRGEYGEAANRLRQGVEREGEGGRDLLLYLLDLGLTLHTSGNYEESNKVFLQADKIAEIKDYTSLASEGATLLVSENSKDYKGEDFEKVLINTYLAINFALMGDHEDALVEARRVNRKLSLMVSEGERKYKQNAFARYLSAVMYEADRNYNDAYVDYKNTRQLVPDYPGLGRDLWRTAWLLGMSDEMERWDREYGLGDEDHRAGRQLSPRVGKAEIVVIYQNGISPVKRPNPSFRTLPKFFPRYNPVLQANVDIDGKPVGTTAVLHNIEATAMENLDEKYAGLIAKKLAGVVAKEVVADQIDKNTGNQGWGALARLILYSADQADLRSWSLLPRDLQMARFTVEPGTHTVRVSPIGDGASIPEKTVQVGKGQKVFVNFRYIPR